MVGGRGALLGDVYVWDLGCGGEGVRVLGERLRFPLPLMLT